MGVRLAFASAACAVLAFVAPALAGEEAGAFVSTCVARLAAKGAAADAVQPYCVCAEKQRQGVLSGRDQRAMDEAMRGKKNAFREAYPELSKDQLAARFEALDKVLAGLAKQTDEQCGRPDGAVKTAP